MIKITWYNEEKSILLADSNHFMLWQEAYKALTQMSQRLGESPELLALYVFIPSDFVLPPNGFTQGKVNFLQFLRDHKLQRVVVVSRNYSLIQVLQTALDLYGSPEQSFYFVHSFEDADALLASELG